MALISGTRLGPYEILAPIGAGGMGEVYRARDTKLDREVAIKVLPEEFAQDDERLARFEREAKLLASLNHPNIASIYGLEESDGVKALVLELVEGPTLAKRIEQGPIPVDETIAIAKQIAEALEAGHETGVIHRDLKPANIKVKEDGTVKVLDYGLAKALEGDIPPDSDSELSQSPTLTRHGTQVGVILGTAAYMSPEQAKGKPVDKRTDIWAFGCVLYEMLTAQKAFPGDDVSETLAAVIRAAPELERLPDETPSAIRRLLRRCLTKDARERLADIADARIELRDAESSDARASRPGPAASYPWKWALLTLALMALTGLAVRSSITPGPDVSVSRFVVSLPEGDVLNMGTGGLTVSTDGRQLAYVASRAGVKQIWVRARDEVTPTLIAGTDGARYPFFSPDAEWLAFFRDDALWKVSLAGGAPQRLCNAQYAAGGTWGLDDTIFFSAGGRGLSKVSAAGGDPVVLDAGFARGTPHVLGGGERVLVTDVVAEPAQIVVHDLASHENRVLIQGSSPRVVGDYLVFVRETTLWAAPFADADASLKGVAVPILDGVNVVANWRLGSYDVAADGSLAYVPGTPMGRLLAFDPSGDRTMIADLADYHSIQLSPDGTKVAGDRRNGGIWVRDLDKGTRVQVGPGNGPVWSPDGSRIAASLRGLIIVKSADGIGDEQLLGDGKLDGYPTSWSRDGKWIAGEARRLDGPRTFTDIWVASPAGDSKVFRGEDAFESGAVFSPDGRWIAYHSDQSGRREVYVEPFPGPGERVAVSNRGGATPVWSRDGRELYYRQDTAVMAVSVGTTDAFSASTPRLVVDGPFWLDQSQHVAFDVFPDGKLLLIDTGQANEIHVVLNWAEELKRLVPTQ